MSDAKKLPTVDSKALLRKHGKEKTKVKFSDRVKCEIVKETKHYKVGQIVEPHKIWADELVKLGIAKTV